MAPKGIVGDAAKTPSFFQVAIREAWGSLPGSVVSSASFAASLLLAIILRDPAAIIAGMIAPLTAIILGIIKAWHSHEHPEEYMVIYHRIGRSMKYERVFYATAIFGTVVFILWRVFVAGAPVIRDWGARTMLLTDSVDAKDKDLIANVAISNDGGEAEIASCQAYVTGISTSDQADLFYERWARDKVADKMQHHACFGQNDWGTFRHNDRNVIPDDGPTLKPSGVDAWKHSRLTYYFDVLIVAKNARGQADQMDDCMYAQGPSDPHICATSPP